MISVWQMSYSQQSIKKDAGPPVRSVEEYHKSIKQNTSVAKSPTRTVQTQTNHLFASILAYIKLERLKFANKMSHFALKAKIYQQALKAAFNELIILKQATLS